MSSDDALVKAALAGQPRAFTRLVSENQALCWHIIHRMVRDPEDARDLCQETFLRVHQRLGQFRGESSLRTWIGRIAYSIALRHLQRKRIALAGPSGEEGQSLLESVPSDIDIASDCDSEEVVSLLLAAIDTLPAPQRAVLTLYHLEELSIAEIAEITGLAHGTIKSQLFRTRLQLRDLLKPVIGETL